MAHGPRRVHITTEAEQHKLDTWEELVEALGDLLDKLDFFAGPDMQLSLILDPLGEARAALKAAKV